MKEVSQSEFYATIGPLNVQLSIVGEFPYTTIFSLKDVRTIIGKAVDSIGINPRIYTKFYLSTK